MVLIKLVISDKKMCDLKKIYSSSKSLGCLIMLYCVLNKFNNLCLNNKDIICSDLEIRTKYQYSNVRII